MPPLRMQQMKTDTLPEPYGVLYTSASEFDEGRPSSDNAAIRILEPEFKNVVIRFTHIECGDPDVDDEVGIRYNYEFVDGHVPPEKLVDFHVTLGNLVFDVILGSFEESNKISKQLQNSPVGTDS